MTEHRLDVSDVCAVLEHVGSARMTEHVASAPRLNARAPQVSLDEIPKTVLPERLAVVGQEERVVPIVGGQSFSNFAEVPLDPSARTPSDREHAIMPSLSSADIEGILVQEHIASVEPDELDSPNAGRVQQLEDGPVANASRRRKVRLRKHAIYFAYSQDMRREAARDTGDDEIGCMIQRSLVGSDEPLEEGLQRIQPCDLRIGGERQAIGLAIMEEIALVVLQDVTMKLLEASYPA